MEWADEMSRHTKSIDSNHMVAVGDEGFLNRGDGSAWIHNAADGVDHEAPTRLPAIGFGITATGATMSWTASTDDRGVGGHDVYRRTGDSNEKTGIASTNSLTLTDLKPGTEYTLSSPGTQQAIPLSRPAPSPSPPPCARRPTGRPMPGPAASRARRPSSAPVL